eukprot:CAMPEP_0196133748 /NCGR_PEP_ID=MMETSP0910-20130528/2841_1 /TAXON_ID=49265 /ORGANISM="Thalassiosira rotula, Strain GSO102" /LENGTH=222 /DNA_ID=CAMNT_0041393499 /DNA_START=105 /DNA_END=773 /DNA_ORIENTATION=-
MMALALAILATSSNGFTTPTSMNRATATTATTTVTCATPNNNEGEEGNAAISRRSILSSLLTATAVTTIGASSAFAVDETMERGGVKLTPFNSLAFNYREGESPTVDPNAIDEVSIPYAEFLEKLAADEVTFVEFLAPNGDKAYATFKQSTPAPATTSDGEDASKVVSKTETTNSKPIRIGEGYPIEDPEGWSSPAFVIKAVAKKGVPYKFVVPGLGDSFKL